MIPNIGFFMEEKIPSQKEVEEVKNHKGKQTSKHKKNGTGWVMKRKESKQWKIRGQRSFRKTSDPWVHEFSGGGKCGEVRRKGILSLQLIHCVWPGSAEILLFYFVVFSSTLFMIKNNKTKKRSWVIEANRSELHTGFSPTPENCFQKLTTIQTSYDTNLSAVVFHYRHWFIHTPLWMCQCIYWRV